MDIESNQKPLHCATEHLTHGQKNELHARYMAGENLKALKVEYGIDAPMRPLQLILPPITSPAPCPNCQSLMSRKWQVKGKPEPFAECASCKHIDDAGCKCPTCKKGALKLVNGRWNSSRVPYGELSLREKILLRALLTGSKHPHVTFGPSKTDESLMPNWRSSVKYMTELRQRGLIVLTEDFGLSKATRFREWGMSTDHAWKINVSGEGSEGTQLKIEELQRRFNQDLTESVSIGDADEIGSLIFEVAFDEARDYLMERFDNSVLELTNYEKLCALLRDMLLIHSMKEVQSDIWLALRSARKSWDDRFVKTRQHASNRVLGNIERATKWRLENPERGRKFERSPEYIGRISRSLHDDLFGGNDAVFNWPLQRYYDEIVLPRLKSGRMNPPAVGVNPFRGGKSEAMSGTH